MSSARSAPITANLLARKGDAAPSVVAPVKARSRPTLVTRDDQSFASEPRQPNHAEKRRRIVVSITQEELERLAIAAIKTGINRHDMVRAALHDYSRKLAAELSHPCACMEGVRAVPPRQAETKSAQPSYPVSVETWIRQYWRWRPSRTGCDVLAQRFEMLLGLTGDRL